jgi:two-component system LytT family sensor kinase
MLRLNNTFDKKYFKVELIFFVIYFYVFRFLTDFEYNFWERKKTGIFFFEVEYNLLYGTSSLIAFWIFYQIIKRYLINKHLVVLIAQVLLFLVFYSFYIKATSYLFAHLDFLSEEMKKLALRQFHFKSIGYSLAYLVREFLSISFLAYFIHVDKQNEQVKLLKEQQLISELTYLKAQLQPHFFFNTLNNIYSLALKQDNNTALLVAKLSEMMRYILYQSDQKTVLLKDEIAFIRNYVEIEHMRYRSAITINLDIQGVDEKSTISPLLLLPFIENAFKHGVVEEVNTGFVIIVICKSEDELMMEVSNSIALTKETKIGGIGLANVEKRLEILYPNRYQLVRQNDGKIYQVSLTLAMK